MDIQGEFLTLIKGKYFNLILLLVIGLGGAVIVALGWLMPINEGPKYIDRGLAVMGVGFSIIGIDFSVVALGIAFRTDEMVKSTDKLVTALADLNFDEKIAAINGYMKKEPDFERLTWDLEALSHIERYASPKQRNKLKNIKSTWIESDKSPSPEALPAIAVPTERKGESGKRKLSTEDSIAFLTAVLVFAAIFSMGFQLLALPLSTQIGGVVLLLAFLAVVFSLVMSYTGKGFWELIRNKK